MNVHFFVPAAEETIKSILLFQTDEERAFWLEPVYHFYPELDRKQALSLPFARRKEYLAEGLHRIYRRERLALEERAAGYQIHWETHRATVENAFSDAFSMDCREVFQDLTCAVSLNPISPRFLKERSFEVFYKNSPQGALGTALHELTHFLWFDRWKGLFDDDYEEYERPSLKWILSEMVVESILRDERLQTLDPYFPREKGGCIYPYFFDMTAGGQLILERIERLYQDCTIEDFMRKAYELCLRHEEEIRRHIAQAEA